VIGRQDRRIALLVAGCFFMENLDGTIVATAAPAMARSLDVPSSSIGLVVTSYLLALAVLIPVSGWMARRWGARRVFLTAIVVFTLASLACALSTDLAQLVAVRVLQGAGGAMMVPVGRFVVLARAEKADLMRVVAWITWPGLLAPVVAPLVGGLLTTYASWHWIFLVNLPLGLLAFVVAWRLVPATARERPQPLDGLGVLLTCAGLGGLAWTAHLLSEATAAWGPTTAWALGSLAVTAWAVRHLLRAPHPLVELRSLRVTTFRASVTGSSLFWIAVGAAPFLLPLLFQDVFGWSPVTAGAVVLFVFVGNVAVKPATSWLLRRFGFRAVLVASTTGVAASLVALGLVTAATPLLVTAALCVLSGVARSVGFTAYNTVAFSDVPPEGMRDANTLAATAQQLGAAFGVAAATVALRAGEPLGRLLPGQPTAATAYTVAFVLLAAVALAATGAAARLHPEAGAAVRGAAAGR